jgi:hypothetical protein
MIDSQAVKNTCNASIESKGFCFYKCTNGIKRHLAVDILGFPAWCIFMVGKPDRKCIRFFTHCTKASVSDDRGLIEMLTHNIDYFKSKPEELPKTTILLDKGYHPEKLTQALEAVYPEMMTKIQFELSAKPSKAAKVAKGQSGFVPVAARWVIERSNAWVERCKSGCITRSERLRQRAEVSSACVGCTKQSSQKFRPHTRTFQRQAQVMFYSAHAQTTSRHLKRSQMGSIVLLCSLVALPTATLVSIILKTPTIPGKLTVLPPSVMALPPSLIPPNNWPT